LKRALVTGNRGQDGTYLTELLEANGYSVAGVDRDDCDLCDVAAVEALLRDVAPREIYNLAAATFVPASWDDPASALSAGVAAGVLLAAIARVDRTIRFFQASSAEVFGMADEVPQSERTPYRPGSPYAVGKACADQLVAAYRVHEGLHASSGILFNHESPLRPTHFLPAKVAHGVRAIASGRTNELVLGDLDARRDWGWAPDYVRAMWLMLQQDEPDDYVIATGVARSVEQLVECAFGHVGLDWREHVRVDESLVRGKAELHNLVGSPEKARTRLGWEQTVSFDELVHLLVDAELERLRGEARTTA
jgi:GDPmannose 4,6-dehydratase